MELSASQFVDDEAVCVDDEQEVDSVEQESSSSSAASAESAGECPPRPLKRSNAFCGELPGKSPWASRDAEYQLQDAVVDDVPDLGEYFANFGLPNESQIAMCRTYANYLAALTRPKRYKKALKRGH